VANRKPAHLGVSRRGVEDLRLHPAQHLVSARTHSHVTGMTHRRVIESERYVHFFKVEYLVRLPAAPPKNHCLRSHLIALDLLRFRRAQDHERSVLRLLVLFPASVRSGTTRAHRRGEENTCVRANERSDILCLFSIGR
jgi:hypothetical protein